MLTGAGMSHKIEFLGTKQVRQKLDNQTTAMIKWYAATGRFPIAPVRRTMQGNRVVFKEVYSNIENRNGGVGDARQRPLAESEGLER